MGRVRWSDQQARVKGFSLVFLDPAIMHQRVADLPVGEQQLVSIAKAFAVDVKLLILDEPSAILADSDIERLFDIVRGLRDRAAASSTSPSTRRTRADHRSDYDHARQFRDRHLRHRTHDAGEDCEGDGRRQVSGRRPLRLRAASHTR